MAAAEIARLAGSLHQGGAPRLERLRGFGTGLVRLPVCVCSRITFNDQTPAVLVIGTETIGAELPFVERIRRLFDGTDQSIAVFSPDGTLVYATSGGNDQIGGLQTLADFGADALAQEAMRTGSSTGTLACGRVIFRPRWRGYPRVRLRYLRGAWTSVRTRGRYGSVRCAVAGQRPLVTLRLVYGCR